MELEKATQLAWRKFLASEHGAKGLLWLKLQNPSIPKGTMESIVFDAGKAEGFRECIDTIPNVLGGEPPREIKVEN